MKYGYSRAALIILFGLLALAVILGIDMIWVIGNKGFEPRLARDSAEAFIVALIAMYFYRIEEKRRRQVHYLNHHIRNSLALLRIVEHQLMKEQSHPVEHAVHRICFVLEQLSRDEDVYIDEQLPRKTG